jgi:hypothetical protein
MNLIAVKVKFLQLFELPPIAPAFDGLQRSSDDE